MMRYLCFLAVGVIASALAPSALADFGIKTGDKIQVRYSGPYVLAGNTNSNPRTGSGGPFEINKVGSLPSFWTFCLETDEHLGANLATYDVTISDNAVMGGSGGPSPDPVSSITKVIYRNYAVGGAATSNSASPSVWSAFWAAAGNSVWNNTQTQNLAVQNAIWFTEQEIGSISGDAKRLRDHAIALLANNTAGEYESVKAMNLKLANGLSQDLLTIVPEPVSILGWLGVSGVFGIGMVVRRRRSR